MGITSTNLKSKIDMQDDDVSTICPELANVAEMCVSRQQRGGNDRLRVGVIARHNQ